ncbi:MAG: hypothetical protein IJZ79_02810 [Bacilli bacterium]|nr:hypothetical protein [Bacilli bacterium]MBQ8218656.1 hypothetical protein [Bacilli bacterium]
MQTYNCKLCGSELYWNAKANCLKCEYCDSEYQVSDFEDNTTTDKPITDESLDSEYVSEELDDGMVAYECKKCSGTVITSKNTMAEICPYCGEAISITSKSVGKFRPKYLIPFKIEKKDATKIYKDYVNKAKYAPKEFKIDNIVEKMQGLYAPFYLHDLTNTSKHLFEGEKTTSRNSGDYRITKHDVYELSAHISGDYHKIPTDGSVRLDDNLLKCVEPYDYNDIKDYNPAYMSGFLAEQTDESKEKLNKMAVDRSKQANHSKAKSLFTEYSSIKDTNNDYSITNHTKDYSMLPVWLLNVKHKDKNYQFAVNGQTGKITGKLPLDYGKVAIISGITFSAVDVIVALLQMGGIF